MKDLELEYEFVRREIAEHAEAIADQLEPQFLKHGTADFLVELSGLYVFDPQLPDGDAERVPFDELERYIVTATAMPFVAHLLAMRGHRVRLTWHAASDDLDYSPLWGGWWTFTLESDDWDAGAALRAARENGGAR